MRNTILAFCAISLPILCQPPDLKTVSGHAQSLEKTVQMYIAKSAEKMPAEFYTFKPTPEVRSFGEIIGHVADDSYVFCAPSLGEKNPMKDSAERIKTKAGLIEALNAGFAYCDKAYAAMNDANAAQPVKFFGSDRARVGVLSFNTAHLFEHYGNIVTYLRLKNIVPPSSEPRK